MLLQSTGLTEFYLALCRLIFLKDINYDLYNRALSLEAYTPDFATCDDSLLERLGQTCNAEEFSQLHLHSSAEFDSSDQDLSDHCSLR
jgi:hypothetical protein